MSHKLIYILISTICILGTLYFAALNTQSIE